MAGVARAMAQTGIGKDSASKAIALIYSMPDPQTKVTAGIVIDAAYAPAEQREVTPFGLSVYLACLVHRGNLSHLLGTST